jgi:hypothetical protein
MPPGTQGILHLSNHIRLCFGWIPVIGPPKFDMRGMHYDRRNRHAVLEQGEPQPAYRAILPDFRAIVEVAQPGDVKANLICGNLERSDPYQSLCNSHYIITK